MGLFGVFELIRETHTTHPVLCMKALTALIYMLQGQQPEGLRNEPQIVIGTLWILSNKFYGLTDILNLNYKNFILETPFSK